MALPALVSCKEDKPYTPFGVATSAPSTPTAEPGAGTGANPASPRAFQPAPTLRAPPAARQWQAGALLLRAPTGLVFESAVVADFDGDGTAEAVAWLRGEDKPNAAPHRPELWRYKVDAPAPGQALATAGWLLSRLPGFLPTGQGCTQSAELHQTGPQTVALDLRAACSTALLPRSPSRALLVVKPAAQDGAELLSLRLAAPTAPSSLALDVDTRDRDGDGHDDILVTTTLGPPNAPGLPRATLRWLDRPSGPSREERFPAEDLAARASDTVVRASGSTTSRQVPGEVAALRQLQAALCAESATSLVWDDDGRPLTCGATGVTSERLLAAEVEAALTRKDLLEAFGALERAGWYGDLPAPKLRLQLEERVRSAAGGPRQVEAVTVPARARAPGSMPRWIPLRFEPSGSLLVLTLEGVSRVSPDGRMATSAQTEVDPWPMTVASQDGTRWTGLEMPCTEPFVAWQVTDRQGTALPSRATRLLAPRPGPCGSRRFESPALPVPVAIGDTEPSALLAGSLIGAPEGTWPAAAASAGSPLSPDGRWLAALTRLGLLLVSRERGMLWTAPWLSQHRGAYECVPANDARAAACVDGTEAVMLLPPASPDRAQLPPRPVTAPDLRSR